MILKLWKVKLIIIYQCIIFFYLFRLKKLYYFKDIKNGKNINKKENNNVEINIKECIPYKLYEIFSKMNNIIELFTEEIIWLNYSYNIIYYLIIKLYILHIN